MNDHQHAIDPPENQDCSSSEEMSRAENQPPTTKESDDAEREQDRQLETGEENPS